jgi:hypothetical protein
MRRVLTESNPCQDIACGFARLFRRQHRNRPKGYPPFTNAAAATMGAIFDDPAPCAVTRQPKPGKALS